MSGHSPEAVKKQAKVYIAVFLGLAILTGLTVYAAQLEVSHAMHVVVALSIATVKGLLVLAFFMHLKGERRLIYVVCYMALFFFVFLLIFTFLSEYNMGPLSPNLW